MKMFHVAFAVAAILGAISTASGQAYPSHPLSIVVGFSAGGPTDTLARNLAEPMRRSLGQPVVIENVTGAAGSIAIARVGRATPDGYTLILGNWNSHVGAAAIYPIQYDVLKDFDPVSLLPVSRLWMVGKIGLPAKDTAELIAWLKANPNKASVAIVGAGSAGHVCSVYFRTRTATSFEFVPYRGGAPAYQAGRLYFLLARPVGPERHAQRRDRQAQCRCRGCLGRRDITPAARRPRSGNSAARPADTGSTRYISQGRNRKVVAAH